MSNCNFAGLALGGFSLDDLLDFSPGNFALPVMPTARYGDLFPPASLELEGWAVEDLFGFTPGNFVLPVMPTSGGWETPLGTITVPSLTLGNFSLDDLLGFLPADFGLPPTPSQVCFLD